MSGSGYKETSSGPNSTSASPPTTDIRCGRSRGAALAPGGHGGGGAPAAGLAGLSGLVDSVLAVVERESDAGWLRNPRLVPEAVKLTTLKLLGEAGTDLDPASYAAAAELLGYCPTIERWHETFACQKAGIVNS